MGVWHFRYFLVMCCVNFPFFAIFRRDTRIAHTAEWHLPLWQTNIQRGLRCLCVLFWQFLSKLDPHEFEGSIDKIFPNKIFYLFMQFISCEMNISNFENLFVLKILVVISNYWVGRSWIAYYFKNMLSTSKWKISE